MIAMETNFSSKVCNCLVRVNFWMELTDMIGIAYQLTENDPLIDANQCELDAALMKTLGANTIRVYHVDPTADHTGCMSAFANAGIYVFLDLDTFTTAIDAVSVADPRFSFSSLTAFIDSRCLHLVLRSVCRVWSSNGCFRQIHQHIRFLCWE